jgi:hypothetical protein
MSRGEHTVPYWDRSAVEKTSVVLDADYDSRYAVAGAGPGTIKLLEKNPQATRRTFLKVLGIGGVGAALMTLPSCLSAQTRSKAQTRALDQEALLKLSYNFFKNGVGVDQRSQLVFERLFISGDQISQWDNRTQPTLNGFYVQFLIDVAVGNAGVDFISSSEAAARLNQLFDTFLSIQQQSG